ncbi:MAG TPA: hypothetical protein VE076_03145 [Nitrososphaeraceae archaeon]|nr:hypothetical protein [Nitrososphaeraceae archaeon]
MTVVMSTKISLAIIAVVAAVGLVTAGSFAATAFAVKNKPNDQVTGTSGSSSDGSTTGLPGTSSVPADYNMPHKTSKSNNDFVANSDQGANPSNTVGSGKKILASSDQGSDSGKTVGSGKKILASSDQGSNSGKTGSSNKELAQLQSCISKAAKGPDGLSRSLVDTCYDQTFYGDFNSQAPSKGSSLTNEASNTGQQFNPRY